MRAVHARRSGVRRLLAGLIVCMSATVARGNEQTASCGSRFIAVGESMQAVLDKCGPPTETFVAPPPAPPPPWSRRPWRFTVVEYWTYDFGPFPLVRHLPPPHPLLTIPAPRCHHRPPKPRPL